MPYKEKDTAKLYYSISEVSKILGHNASQIRFWEKEFDIIKPHKNKKGNRLFTLQDIEAIKKVHQLVKLEGYTIEGAKQAIVKVAEPADVKSENALKYLHLIKEKLTALKDKSSNG